MRVQHAVWELLREDVEFESLRVETNRPDGSGEVGVEQAVAEVADIRRVKGEDFRLWRQHHPALLRRRRDLDRLETDPQGLRPKKARPKNAEWWNEASSACESDHMLNWPL